MVKMSSASVNLRECRETKELRLLTKKSDFDNSLPVVDVIAGGILAVVFVFIVVICLHKRRNFCPDWTLKRVRGSSTTSFEPLTNEGSRASDIPRENSANEFFSIRNQNGEGKDQPHAHLGHGTLEDQDGGYDGRPGLRNATQDDYFYDEIFERSAFVDVTTNRANKDLTILTEDDYFDDPPDLGDASVPDLVFKTSSSRM